MSNNWKISSQQFGILVALYTIGTTILIITSGLVEEAKQDAWISVILGIGITIPLIRLYHSIGDLYPNRGFVEIMEAVFGKWIGKGFSILFILFSFTAAMELIWIAGTFVTTQVMTETPMIYINIIFTAVVIFGIRLGIETLGRSGEILFPWVILLFLILIILSTPDLNIENMQPLFEGGIKPILRGTLTLIGTFSFPLVVLLMIFPFNVDRLDHGKKAFFIGMLVAGIIMLIITVYTIAILGSDFAERNMYPTYVLAKKIDIGHIIQRMEVIIAGLWLITIYFKTTLYFYGAVLGLSQVLNLEDYRSLTLPLGMIAVVFSLIIYPNATYFIISEKNAWPPFAMVYGLFLPLAVLILGKIRKNKKGNSKT